MTEEGGRGVLCMVHGYGLSGSGSNLWTREVVRALVENGETVHLVCQERKPERYPFVAEAWTYDADGEPERVFTREQRADGAGRAILHRPHVDVLPTYVRPGANRPGVQCALDMDDTAVERYLRTNEAALARVVADHPVRAIHVNHLVLMSEAVRRVCESTGLPYQLMPHGSALEYVVKKDERMHRLAADAVAGCRRMITLSEELRDRVVAAFPDLDRIVERTVRIPPGVDVRSFRPAERDERPERIGRLEEAIAEVPRGRTAAQTRELRDRIAADFDRETMGRLLAEVADHPEEAPDADLEERLEAVDWEKDEVIVYVGRLLGHKGVPAVLAALPEIIQERPRARLIVVGGGPLRTVLEAWAWALARNDRPLARKIMGWGASLEGQGAEPFAQVQAYFAGIEWAGKMGHWYELARRNFSDRPGSHAHEPVLFTGFLEHDALRHLLACADLSIFPSMVPEAGPLVAVEAMASGCFPMGTDQAGIRSILDTAAREMPAEVVDLGRLSPDPEQTLRDMVKQAPRALEESPRRRGDWRRVAEEHFDWRSIGERIAGALRELGERAA